MILVEGVYPARPELRRYVDLAIYVETPRAEREGRLRARGQDEAARIARWMAAEEWYEREQRGASARTSSGGAMTPNPRGRRRSLTLHRVAPSIGGRAIRGENRGAAVWPWSGEDRRRDA